MCSQNPSDTYAHLLLTHGHGYPLWVPEPNDALPEEYRASGVRIGDVGLVTADGGFNFLFNVFTPKDHIINQWHGVPEGFVELVQNQRLFRIIPQLHEPGIPICSSGTETLALGAEASASVLGGPLAIGAGFELKFTQSRGAVLMLPNGASRVDYQDLAGLRKYIVANAESWYQFMNASLGLEAQNGSLYLITGYDKTCAWEVAAFSDPEQRRIISLKFTANGLGDGRLHMTHSSVMHSSLSRRSHLGSETQNQAVFIRGFKIRLRQWARAMFRGSVKVANIMGLEPRSVMKRGDIVPSPRSGASSSSSSQSGSSEIQSNGMATDSVESTSPATLSDVSSPDSSISSDFEELTRQIYHPSDAINEYILEKVKEQQPTLEDILVIYMALVPHCRYSCDSR
ncbi:hypothetical protein GYMLUDRAFT_157344 [Collybiopsis luxurians FD-317 M1]|nr:hypothetical protein GYMLUDRAFT_157344 [Collybiopsis luxurians FD-317 M1]